MAKTQEQKHNDYVDKIITRFTHIVVYEEYIDWDTPIWHYCLIHWKAFSHFTS